MVLSNAAIGRAILALALFGQPLLPQQAPKNSDEDLPPPIKVDVNVVNILASVRDKHGALISNLKKDDFQILEDGKAQTIKYFERQTDLPLTIGLLVDVSKSQENLIEIEKRAAYEFFAQVLRKKDEAFLISFGSEAELLQDLTGSPKILQRGLDQLRLSVDVGGLHPGPVPTADQPRGTILYDAVYLAAHDELRHEVGRKVIVLLTDGVDEGSRLKVEDAIEAAQKTDAVVYGIYYYDPGAYGPFFAHPSDSALKRMAEETGGHVFKVDRKHSLADVFNELQQEMRSQYAIGYTPTDSRKDGSYRKLDIKVADKNLRVQARKGYYASN